MSNLCIQMIKNLIKERIKPEDIKDNPILVKHFSKSKIENCLKDILEKKTKRVTLRLSEELYQLIQPNPTKYITNLLKNALITKEKGVNGVCQSKRAR